MRDQISRSVQESIRAAQFLAQPQSILFIENAAKMIAGCFQKGGKIIIAGNGGSLCDGMHFAEELTGYFRSKRKALPAIALAEPGHITCVGNDAGFENIFSRGVEAYGKPGDIFIGLTTSGKSPNLIKALEAAKHHQLKTIFFLGKGGGKLKGLADLELLVEGFDTSDRIQEAHMAAIHILIEIVEYHLFPEQKQQP